ncbi:predicted protein [Nematostella vectensis]|uniref:Lipase n=1 Tax=Nematostella vectensis TaxID=45351 RepID=A7SVU2_NEMVE|nr:predicted protein [Nematostella vectensis]|eukprot:XP_001624272.1 predicted protein [Nematostella vectensis]
MAKSSLYQPFFVALVSLCILFGTSTVDSKSVLRRRKIKEIPDAQKNVSQLIWEQGYSVQEHYVQTRDGFILNMQRIPDGRTGKLSLSQTSQKSPQGTQNTPQESHGKPVVFLQHGILADATNWVMDSASHSLGYILADSGFDVWLGNVRGNDYSRRNVHYQPSVEEFWDWSYQEMADIDLPVMIDYVLQTTGQSQLFYIGHSQGTLMGFTGFSDNTTLAKQIKLFIALAPVYTLKNCTALARDANDIIYPLLEKYFSNYTFEFFAGDFVRWLTEIGLCGKWTEKLCYDLMETVVGFDSPNINETRVPVYVSHFFEGTSFKDIVHFSQMMYQNRCQKFDYGEAGNMKRYNKTTPPLCHVQDMPTPTVLFYGEKDGLGDPVDAQALKSLVQNLVHSEEMKEWNHLDFLYGVDASKLLYPRIVDLLKASL